MPDTLLLELFRTETARLTGRTPTPEAALGLAVSGGPDSLALLLLAADAYPSAIKAATVDHKLRPEAADEAQYVADICARLSVPHEILAPQEPISGNIQSSARAARYALLEQWRTREGLAWIATAHHADDQFETVLMRLLRGSGIDGLSAIRPINGTVIRPLLTMRKAALSAYVARQGIEAVADPSNRDDAFDRVRLRKTLADLPSYDPVPVSRSVSALREAGEALQWMCKREAERAIEVTPDSVRLTHGGYPPELLRRLAIHCLDHVDSNHGARGPAIERIVESLSAGKKCTIGQILCSPESAEIWCFSKAPPRKTG